MMKKVTTIGPMAAVAVAGVLLAGCAKDDAASGSEADPIDATATPIPDGDDGPRSDASERGETSGMDSADAAADAGGADEATPETYVLGYTMESIDGEPVDLASYRGKVVLMVNTASRCGLTPQYAGLQSLYERHADAGLVVLGFPANNFMGQEPGTNAEIAAFCERNYGVTFPMFSKISVLGEDQHPLFAQLSQQTAEPEWNFTKYLVDREGNLVARFGPRTQPSDAAMVSKIEELLAAG